MKVTFLGGAGTVTGSKYLLETGGRRILIDCGLFQGLKDLRLRNWAPFPLPPASIDTVILTHAHLDHSGYVPRLVKAGFAGPVYCTAATLDLCKIILPDSGYIQEEDAARANRRGYTKHAPALPLYTQEDAHDCLAQFKAVPFETRQDLGGGLGFTMGRAGHILGAAWVRIDDGKTSILFSGDLGRVDNPIIQPPAPPAAADYLVVESTYGDRLHAPSAPEDELEHVILKTLKRQGSVIIPAFAVGRAQEILYYLHQLKSQKRIPTHLPVYLDSPMAINASDLLAAHPEDHRLSQALCEKVCSAAQYVHTREESKALDVKGRMPSIIISASGMATGGRVLHHLAHYLDDARHTILLAGFQAAGTRGARLARGEPELKMFGRMIPVRAEIVQMHSMSAHADAAGLMAWIGAMPTPPRHVFVTHGEPQAALALQTRIEKDLNWAATVPAPDGSVTL